MDAPASHQHGNLHAFAALNDHWGRQASIDQDVITVLSQILEGEASESPKGALQWLSKLSPALLDARVIQAVIRGWASHSPKDALSFPDSLPNNFSFLETSSADLSQQGRVELGRAWSQSDPEAAARWILALSPEAQKRRSLCSMLPQNTSLATILPGQIRSYKQAKRNIPSSWKSGSASSPKNHPKRLPHVY